MKRLIGGYGNSYYQQKRKEKHRPLTEWISRFYGFPLETLLTRLVGIQRFLFGHSEGGTKKLNRNKQNEKTETTGIPAQ